MTRVLSQTKVRSQRQGYQESYQSSTMQTIQEWDRHRGLKMQAASTLTKRPKAREKYFKQCLLTPNTQDRSHLSSDQVEYSGLQNKSPRLMSLLLHDQSNKVKGYGIKPQPLIFHRFLTLEVLKENRLRSTHLARVELYRLSTLNSLRPLIRRQYLNKRLIHHLWWSQVLHLLRVFN